MDPFNFQEFWKPFRQNSRRFQEIFPHHEEFGELTTQTETLAYLIRSYSVYSMTCGALGHPGGSFSEAEILAVLYNYVLRFDAKDPQWPARDVFYLSKCHACPGLYSVLALFDYFDIRDLTRYGQWGSHLESHPDSTTTPGIEISGGSLGQIPGVAVGRALGIRRHGPDPALIGSPSVGPNVVRHRVNAGLAMTSDPQPISAEDRMVYCVIGDGECNEGSVWEAFMAAGHYRLDNLVFLIDYNKVQAKGFVHADMAIEPLADKLAAFNLEPWEVNNGHNVAEIIDLFNTLHTQRRGKPNAVILNTIKGKGIGACQYNPNWHTSAPRDKQTAQDWLTELWHRDGKRLGVPEEFPRDLGQAIAIVPPLHENPDQITEKQA